MAKSLQEARGTLMSDIETLNNLLHSLGETWGETGCRFQGKGWVFGGQGSPAHWFSCLMAIQAELDEITHGLSKETRAEITHGLSKAPLRLTS